MRLTHPQAVCYNANRFGVTCVNKSNKRGKKGVNSMENNNMADIFIGHSGHAGEEAARGIRSILHGHAVLIGLGVANMRVFIAPDSLSVGSDIDAEIRRNIQACGWFVLIVTHESNKSWYVHYEMEMADAYGKPILPILGVGMTPDDLPNPVKRKFAISIMDIRKVNDLLVDIVEEQKVRVWERNNTQHALTGNRVTDASQTRRVYRREIPNPSQKERERTRPIAGRSFSDEEIRRLAIHRRRFSSDI